MSGKVTRRRSTGQATERKNFKWEPFHLEMANYVRDNYEKYKNALAANRKVGFLRELQTALGVTCTELQLKNGFYNFLKKYSDVKQKLNSSGFGIDPEKDKSLEKGWILKACPYFEILDEVMGTRPNLCPPCILSTSASVQQAESATTPANDDQVENLNADTSGKDLEEDELLDMDEPMIRGKEDKSCESSEDTCSSADPTSHYVKKALSGIDMKRKQAIATKSPMGVFAKVMEDKTALLAKVEQDKLGLQQKQFVSEQKVAKERNEIERLKVNLQNSVEVQRIELERERIAERRAEREHELRMLQLKQEFELKKMELSKQD